MRLIALLMVLSSAATAADQCKRDSDCGSGKTCIANKCSASREDEAAVGAGMALQYTKNTWPMSLVDRPLVVAPGMTEITAGFDKDLTSDLGSSAPLRPFGAGITARYGVSDRIHAGIDVLSVCFTDCDLTGFFRQFSIGAGYAVVANRDMNFVPAITLPIYSVLSGFDITTGSATHTTAMAIQPGFLFGYRVNQVFQLFANGGFVFPFVGRDNAADLFAFHIEPRFQVIPRFSVAPYIGYQLSLKNTDNYAVPVGLNLLYIADRTIDIGAGFELNNVTAKDPFSWSDFKSFNIFGTFRL